MKSFPSIRCMVAVAAAIAALGVSTAHRAVAAEPAKPAATPTATDRRPNVGRVSARGVLTHKSTNVDLNNVPLSDVMEYLRDVGQLNLFVNWPALEAAGVDRSTPVTLKLRGVRLSKVLELSIAQANPTVPLQWYIADNIVYVTTKDLAEKQVVTVVYPIQDLIVEVPNFVGPTFNLDSNNGSGGGRRGGGQGGGGGSSNSGNLFSGNGTNNSNADNGTTVEERAQHIVELIQSIVEPDIWEANGGTARIRFFNGNLVITAPRNVHERINGPVD